ncbi:MAG TPA: sigma 54-interacting transcriptional regulator [Acidobacteriaceae bacterium]|jgi:DNA-binding NtrC family response regulator
MSTTYIPSEGRFQLLHMEAQTRSRGGTAIDDDGAFAAADSILLGESAAVQRLRSQIQRIAPYFRVALIHGETGSGKQMVARALHAHSPGAERPFVMAQASDLGEPACAAVGESLLELARGGTLYLAGVGELSSGQQEFLLRLLLAYSDGRGTGVRIVASSGRDLRMLAAMGEFRPDLYARLSAVEIVVPPLRQRVDDIPALAARLLRRLAEETREAPKVLAKAAVAELKERTWPGNLRELERVVARAAAFADAGWIEPRHLLAALEPAEVKPVAEKMEGLQEVMMRHVLDVLTRCRGNKVRAAQVLGISRSTLYRMLGARAAAQGSS